MTFQQFISSIGFSNGFSFWAVVAFLMSIGIEIIPKVKWSPWSRLFKWLGTKLNSGINENVEKIDKKVDALQKELLQHITDSETKALQDIRRDILNFCNSCMNGTLHTKEEFDFVIAECDKYETYIEENKIKNGVITAAINEVRRLNKKCIENNSFLKEGERQ